MSTNHGSPLGKIRAIVIVSCLLLIIGIFAYAYLSDTNNTVIGKDEIITNIEALDDKDFGYTYVSSYLKKYGIGNLNSYKINAIEQQLESDFFKELPAEKEIAKTTSLLFVEYFYDNIDLNDKKQVTDSVLECMLASIGDPYAFYLTQEKFLEYITSLEGGEEFVGIGVIMNQETLEILMVYPDSGAEDAGIQSHDILYAVDGKTLDDLPKEEFINLLKGEADTFVSVTVKRGDELLTFEVMRKVLVEKSVYYHVTEDKIGIIQITQFLQDTPQQFIEAVDSCEENGAVALVIDVRYNPGGLIDSVVAVIDYLTPDAEDRRIGSYTHHGMEYVYYTTDGHSVDLPIAVICNQDTASAGELFTAAMRDYGKDGILDTVVVGVTTYGKGVAQNSYTLYDASGIRFTIGYFNPPSNVNFDGVGVIPEFIVEEAENTDAPLSKAIEEVKKLANTNGSVEINIDAAA